MRVKGFFAVLGATANMQPLWATHEPQMDELTIPFLGERRSGFGGILFCFHETDQAIERPGKATRVTGK